MSQSTLALHQLVKPEVNTPTGNVTPQQWPEPLV